MTSVRAVIYGVGAMGSLIARAALQRSWLEVVGAVDVDPRKVGRDLGEVIGFGERLGVSVEGEAGPTLKRARPEVVLHATRSLLPEVRPQIMEAVNHGACVISTCETLAYPFHRYPEIASMIDLAARRAGVTVVGAGVNPGFLLDLLPSILSSTCLKVRSLKAVRVVDAGKRRKPFREKVGLGLKPAEFEKLLRSGKLTGHVGYAESTYLIADMMGVELDSVEEGQEPIIAERAIEVGGELVEAGKVAGIRGYGIGYLGGRELIKIEFVAQAGVEEEYEEVLIEGEPGVRWRSCGTQGDLATAAIIVNMVPRVLEAEPGLTLVSRLPPPSYAP